MEHLRLLIKKNLLTFSELKTMFADITFTPFSAFLQIANILSSFSVFLTFSQDLEKKIDRLNCFFWMKRFSYKLFSKPWGKLIKKFFDLLYY